MDILVSEKAFVLRRTSIVFIRGKK